VGPDLWTGVITLLPKDVGIEPVWMIWLNNSNKIGAISSIVVLKISAGIPSIPVLLPTGS